MRLERGDVACWVVKTRTAPEALVPGWGRGEVRVLRRCLRPSYRLALMAPGQRVLLWLSGRAAPGVHAIGVLTTGPDEESAVEVALHLLESPVARPDLVPDRAFATAEVVRMPAGSNPSSLTADQLRPVLDHLDPGALRAAGWH